MQGQKHEWIVMRSKEVPGTHLPCLLVETEPTEIKQ